MEEWRKYLFSIIICSLSCRILSQLLADSKIKDLVCLICGIFVAIVIMRPLTGQSLEDIIQFPVENWNIAEKYIADGQKTASEKLEDNIKASCQAYILDKAKALGTDITVRVSLNEKMIPAYVEIIGVPETAVQTQIQDMLMTDLGIPKENQEWISNQKSSGSFLP